VGFHLAFARKNARTLLKSMSLIPQRAPFFFTATDRIKPLPISSYAVLRRIPKRRSSSSNLPYSMSSVVAVSMRTWSRAQVLRHKTTELKYCPKSGTGEHGQFCYAPVLCIRLNFVDSRGKRP
jgi:hypothetical protein